MNDRTLSQRYALLMESAQAQLWPSLMQHTGARCVVTQDNTLHKSIFDQCTQCSAIMFDFHINTDPSGPQVLKSMLQMSKWRQRRMQNLQPSNDAFR